MARKCILIYFILILFSSIHPSKSLVGPPFFYVSKIDGSFYISLEKEKDFKFDNFGFTTPLCKIY